MNNFQVLLGIVLICLAYISYLAYGSKGVKNVRDSTTGKSFLVRNLPDKTEAASLLGKVGQRLDLLVTSIRKKHPDDPRTKRILRNFDSGRIAETATEDERYTSYSVNKGEQVMLCIRSRDEKKELVDLNTLMFVAIHELGHIASKSFNHTKEFWDNFTWLLEEAVTIGVYEYVDYGKKNQKYCGMNITDTPMKPKTAG